MATRFYFPGATAAQATVALDAAWQFTTGNLKRYMTRTKGASAVAVGSTIGAWTITQKAVDRQYVSDPMAAGVSFTTSQTVKGQIQAQEVQAADDVNQILLGVRVVSRDGSTVRATLLAVANYGTTTELSTSQRNKTFANTDALTANYTTVLGDRLVVEIGYTDAGTGSTPQAASRYGENAADLPEDETTTTAGAGWIEFTTNINFEVPVYSLNSGTFPGQRPRNIYVQQSAEPFVLIPPPTSKAWVQNGNQALKFKNTYAWASIAAAAAFGTFVPRTIASTFIPDNPQSKPGQVPVNVYVDQCVNPVDLIPAPPATAVFIPQSSSSRPGEVPRWIYYQQESANLAQVGIFVPPITRPLAIESRAPLVKVKIQVPDRADVPPPLLGPIFLQLKPRVFPPKFWKHTQQLGTDPPPLIAGPTKNKDQEPLRAPLVKVVVQFQALAEPPALIAPPVKTKDQAEPRAPLVKVKVQFQAMAEPPRLIAGPTKNTDQEPPRAPLVKVRTYPQSLAEPPRFIAPPPFIGWSPLVRAVKPVRVQVYGQEYLSAIGPVGVEVSHCPIFLLGMS